MSPKPEDKPQGGQGTGPGNKGQDKTYTITNPATGEQREVTQRQWREEKLGQQGWEKPADLDDSGSLPESPEQPPDSGTTTP